MKNSIFKSYAKKVLKSQAFVSVLIVFVLSLGIIGTSYSLYMDVDKDTDYQIVQVGDLAISFDNGSNVISLTNMTPTEDENAIKLTDNIFSFYVYNTGTYKIDYDINLETIDGNEVDTKYINYQICKDNADNCTQINTLGTNTLIRKEILEAKKASSETNPSAYYFLRIWINNKYPTNELKSNNIKLKVVINAKNLSGELESTKTLSGKLLNDDRIKINYDKPNFKVAESEEKGLYLAEDDYGTSYYFRGTQSYNYVSFANQIWKIIRINGDGSIRLTTKNVVGKSYYNENTDDNAYAGYMYGLTGVETNENRCLKLNESNEVENIISTYSTKETCESNGGTWTQTAYEATHANIKNSTVKDFLDNWYSTNIVGKTNTNGDLYTDYISDEIFCNEKTLTSENGKGYAKNFSLYSTGRIMSSSNPTFICTKNATNDLSRFTIEKQTLKNGTTTNGKLIYPIGLVSADELKFSGLIYGSNTSANGFLLAQGWSMTPYHFESNKYVTIFISGDQKYPIWLNSSNNQQAIIHPVINLKKDVLIESGDGTLSNPYTLKLK